MAEHGLYGYICFSDIINDIHNMKCHMKYVVFMDCCGYSLRRYELSTRHRIAIVTV